LFACYTECRINRNECPELLAALQDSNCDTRSLAEDLVSSRCPERRTVLALR
jgi:hypothetical protein